MPDLIEDRIRLAVRCRRRKEAATMEMEVVWICFDVQKKRCINHRAAELGQFALTIHLHLFASHNLLPNRDSSRRRVLAASCFHTSRHVSLGRNRRTLSHFVHQQQPRHTCTYQEVVLLILAILLKCTGSPQRPRFLSQKSNVGIVRVEATMNAFKHQIT